MNRELTQSIGFNLSKELETKGFDLQAGQTWVYPTNYPIREYQFSIVQKALLNNTLVSLPTGLGKTFIAAVVMYNYFRWYPMGKVVFMAPTRPLVKQQIDACYDIMAIPKEVTAELTGTKLAMSRGDIWKEKRVFFVTPQILQNDLETLKNLGPEIKCLVFDEAHRARGNHAYCEVIRKLVGQNKFFRVLALSATPGSTIGDVLEVVSNLLISHLEFRTEESLDVHPYVYKRNLTTVVVPLGDKLQSVRDDYLQILEYYTKTLMKYNVIQGNCGNLTKGKIFMTMKEFQKNRVNSSPNYSEIMKSLNICVTLYHAFELLTRHGLRSFISFFSEHIDKPLLRNCTRLKQIVNDVKEYLGPEPTIETLPDGSNSEISKTVKFGHPKFYKLRDILLSHFSEADDSSRVIVFFEYRNSVMEAYSLLVQAKPILKPRIFLGQGHGITQRLQINVVNTFREGQCNVLLSTCIGEEGLDVGNVDLIVCFDISNKSPIRMVQRMGRTGRKKEGHIIALVTEGKEQQILKDCLIHKNNIAFHVLSSRELARGLNASSPRLVPEDISPKCEKIHITVRKQTVTKTGSLKDMFRNTSSSSSDPTFSPDLELIEIEERLPATRMLWNTERPLKLLEENCVVSNIFSKKIEKQRGLQPIHQVGHSKSSEALVELLQLADSKRFNIPVTQIGSTSQLSQGRNLRQGDIRNMFTRLQPSFDIALTQSQSSKSIGTESNAKEENYCLESKELFTEISNYLSIQMQNDIKKCRHCPDNFDCTVYNSDMPSIEVSWVQLDDSIFDTITSDDMKAFTKSLDPLSTDFDDLNLLSTQQDDIFSNINVTQLEKIAQKVTGNANISLEQIEESIIQQNEDVDISYNDKSCAYEAPKNLNLLISRYGASIIETEVLEEISQDIQNLQASNRVVNDIIIDQEIFKFFRADSLLDILNGENIAWSSQETIIYSPDIIDATIAESRKEEEPFSRKQNNEALQMSPVLNVFNRSKRLKKITVSDRLGRPNLQNLKVLKTMAQDREIETPSKFTMNATKISSTPLNISEKNCETVIKRCANVGNMQNLQTGGSNESIRNKGSPKDKVDIDDICDLSAFGISPVKNKATPVSKISDEVVGNQISDSLPSKTSAKKGFDIDDFCDLTSFGISHSKTQSDNHGEQKSLEPNIIPTKPTGSLTLSKSQSQMQLPITQLLSLINRDETSAQQNMQRPTVILRNVINDENNKSHKAKADLPTKKSKLSLNKTTKASTGLDSPVRKSQPKKNLNNLFAMISSSNEGDSDDDFEPSSPVFKRPRLMTPQGNRGSSKNVPNQKPSPVTNNKKKKPKNLFIEDEALLSEDEEVFVSEDEDDENQSVYDASFVADETQHMDTQMHARYLQSLRSPHKKSDIRTSHRPKINITSVYSQEVDHEDDTYLDDSFVVHDEIDSTLHELSELEILENKLKEQSRKVKRKNSDGDGKPSKRRRIFLLSDDSD